MFKIRNQLTRKVAKILYYSIAYPYLNYCNIVWTSCYPSSLQSLITIQKKLIRFVTKRNRWTPSTPLFRELMVLKLNDINRLNTAIFVYKSIHNLISSPINFLIRAINIYNLRNHNNIDLEVPRHRSRQSELFIHVRGARLWNEIPLVIRSKPSVCSFKFHLKRLYLDSYQ